MEKTTTTTKTTVTTTTTTSSDKKGTIYNLIILDKSGSMSDIREQAIGGVNETIGSIKADLKKNPDTKQFITLMAFCACEKKYILDKAEASTVNPITKNDYQPCCGTPLYDAIGLSVNRLSAEIADDPLASVCVTIITDGYENSSKEFSHEMIAKLIKDKKEQGWMFAYIGADHDVETVRISLNIDNAMAFEKTDEGTHAMFSKLKASRSAWSSAMSDELMNFCYDRSVSEDELKERKKKISKGFFTKGDNKTDF